jgi:hypothetical protein
VLEAVRDLTYGSDFTPGLTWSLAARARVDRIPSFVRGVVVKRVEDWARRQGLREVTPELLAEVRRARHGPQPPISEDLVRSQGGPLSRRNSAIGSVAPG